MKSETLLKPLFFLHLPKTAGASVESSIIEALNLSRRRISFLPRGGWVRVHDQPDWTKRADVIRRARTARFVFGHFHRATYLEMTQGIDHFAFTFLRDPRERLRSAFRYSRSAFPKLTYPVNSTGLKFSEYLGHPDPKHQWLVDNMMTRMLGGNYGEDPRSDADWNDLVANACRRLEKLNFIGLTSNLDNDLPRLFAKLNLPPPVMTPRTNVTREEDRVSANRDDDTLHDLKATQLLGQCTRYDRLVYEYGLRLIGIAPVPPQEAVQLDASRPMAPARMRQAMSLRI